MFRLPLILAALAPSSADRPAELLGQTAPPLAADFAVNGKPVTPADLMGKVVLLHFWALWCQPCRDDFPALRDWQTRYRRQGLEVIGVTRYYRDFAFDKGRGRVVAAKAPLTAEQERDTVKEFAAHYRLGYRLLMLPGEAGRKAFADYGAGRLPLTVVIDRDGKVRLVKVGAGKGNTEAVDRVLRELLVPHD
jgi:thiol-disulfide isomerase/thioredoxin